MEVNVTPIHLRAGGTSLVVASAVLPPWQRAGVTLPGRVLRLVGVEAPSLDVDRSVLLRVVGA
ncbi:hypothetical protein GCM10009555_094020 [Acrocarpospora macrocephala]|uniref:Uncharacterized protein n=1 Tax=Acrocarpospora macrocephala TaxID=150177 RepID=A0A5M3WW92_9ACTN|nr:hypothetical protein [Acrocarpospora macrocephala]GES11581.1 hypothetical protein Amac_051780 [Acrocarpospora macrocephala]